MQATEPKTKLVGRLERVLYEYKALVRDYVLLAKDLGGEEFTSEEWLIVKQSKQAIRDLEGTMKGMEGGEE